MDLSLHGQQTYQNKMIIIAPLKASYKLDIITYSQEFSYFHRNINNHVVRVELTKRQACSSKGISLLTFKTIVLADIRKIPKVIAKSSLSLYNLATTIITTAE